MSETAPKRVRRRRVFYIPGYDPFPPRRYRELYRSESARQAAISGYQIALSPAREGGSHGWQVQSTQDGNTVETEFEVLLWSDIVRGSMGASIPATYGQLLRTAWIYTTSGALFRLMRLRKGPIIAALYPVAVLLVQAVVAVALGWAAAALTRGLLGAIPAALLGLAAAALTLRWFRAKDRHVFAYYLMHDFAFSARWRGAYPPELEARMALFRDTIARALLEDWDEVLVVGHSSGAHLAVSILSDLLRADRKAPGLSLLTLGQVVPMISFLPDAQRLRRDLAFLSAHKDIAWVDVTAPGDGCAFALCDPVKVSGVAPEDQRWPLILSAAFTQTLAPETWARLRWRFFRLHFQYLCAFEQPRDYDYFRITAGPETLGDRFAGRAPSKSRIEHPVNRHTSLA
ncbi:hypothetical protein O5O51_08540 [Sinirhodobacter sp. HNIBRBA609]|nr:hypothetical protein O5O51_08540 [Sinirhodobacter sp. HNIBRBA609]